MAMAAVLITKTITTMKKALFSTMIASLLAFAGCQQEELVNDNITPDGGEKVILTANIQGAAQTRVSLTAGTNADNKPIVKVEWNESGETFEVIGTSDSSTFTQIPGTNQFEGTLPESTTGKYEVYYGNPNSLDEQDGKLGQSTAIDSPVLMSAMFDSSSPSITFEHETAILKPTFKLGDDDINNSITKIVMGNVAKSNLGNGPRYDVITITPTSPATVLDDNIYIHLLVFPQVYIADHEFTFTVTAGENEYTASLTIPRGKSIEAGKLYTADITLTKKEDLRYDSATKTFYVSSAKGLMELNQWMNNVNDSSHNTFIGLKFSGYESVSSSSRLANNITLENDIELPLKTYTGADITINDDGTPSNSNWTDGSNGYTGTFDGNNKTISNLVLYNRTSFIYSLGVGGIIKNLTLKDVIITSTTQNAIVGVAFYNKGLIDNCHVSGTIRNTKNEDSPTAGGIVFQNQSNGKIINCTNSATVSSNQSAGGIAYQNYGSIIGCMNSGAVTGGSISDSYVGGVVGWSINNGVLVACGNTGAVVPAGTNVGGILGQDWYSKGVYGCWTLKINETDTDNDGIGSSPDSNTSNCFSAAAKETSQSDKEYINSKVNDMNGAIKNATLPDGVAKYYWVKGTNDWPTLTTTEPQ
jgi:hypothetical protein